MICFTEHINLQLLIETCIYYPHYWSWFVILEKFRNGKVIITVILLLIYLLILAYLLFFSNYRNSVHGIIDYNIIPLKSIISYFVNFNGITIQLATDNLFGNIFAFIPLGLLLPMISNLFLSYRKILTVACLTSLLIEITQFINRVGTFDIDDILLNTTGAIIGYSIALVIIQLVYNKKRQSF
ncbi:VanZ family protein [Aquibacillus saliphilus]|uniref:VanZ family protein n=1 Tax=Aquibacillus saliphilus TaxID=1909422 RepID=UPI001CF09274|nr:VanZ family protein [Aquibacillus saliphilus]